jgi:tRNA pseudouridine55 synthase
MPRRPKPPGIDGALIVNKPAGRTSHDVVDAVRGLVGFRQVGHLGTLDPLATGVLVLLLGRATRLARFYGARRKRYQCAVRFGFATNTYDADGSPLGPDCPPELTPEALTPLAEKLTGHFQMTPPPFSAKKIHGHPAHELARKKRAVELKPVEVDVYEFRLLEVAGPLARFAIECGPGTYIRSLAHELGRMQGNGAHLAEIVRTAVGEFTLDQAASLEELRDAASAGRLAARVIPMEGLLPDLPRVTVLPVVERRVQHGARFTVQTAHIQPGRVVAGQGAPEQLDSGEWKPARLRVFNQQEKLIAVAQAIVPRTYQPLVVFEAAP